MKQETKIKYRVNNDIKSNYVQLIDEKSFSHGKITLDKALQLAEDRDLDLVEVGANQNPPICKLLDYGKFRYQVSKKLHNAKKKQKQLVTKELKIRPRIDVHDFKFRLKRGEEFINEGYKVKYSMHYRGRESNLSERGDKLFDEIINKFELIAEVESYPNKSQNYQALILIPRKK